MKQRLSAYQDLVESDIPWIDGKPLHWKTLRTKWLFRNKKVLNQEGEKAHILSLTLRGVVDNNPDSPEGLVPKDYNTYQVFKAGDLVFKLIDLENFKTSRVGLVPRDGIMSPAYLRLIPIKKMEVKYFYYQFFNLYLQGVYNKLGEGVRSTLGSTDLGNLPILIPPLEEQQNIVNFIQQQDRRIRRFIKNKKRLIGLLEERKAAVFRLLLQTGADGHSCLRNSGVEWLGQLPAHWRALRLKRAITKIEQGWSPQCYGFPAAAGEWAVLKVGCVNHELFRHSENKKFPVELGPVPSLQVKDGDILVSRANTRELVGLAALVKEPPDKLMLCDKLFRFRAISSEADPRFLVRIIRSATSRKQIEAACNGASTSMQNIGQGVIRNLWVPLPSLTEQKLIVDKMDRETKEINSAIDVANTEIVLLHEYRTRLIADAVTGKIDLRSFKTEDIINQTEDDLIEIIDEPSEDESEELLEEAANAN